MSEEMTPEQFRAMAGSKAFKSHRRRHTPGEMNKTDWQSHGVITFTIPGLPLGKPRMTQRDKWKKRPCVVAYRAWADIARLSCPKLPPPEMITRLDWTAVFAVNPGTEGQIGTQHREKPDRDNIDKAILDALFEDDSSIAYGTIRKEWGEQDGIVVTIEYGVELNDRDAGAVESKLERRKRNKVM